MRRTSLLTFLGAVTMFGLVAGARADCGGGARPAATLLFPFFEVELSGASGRTTLLAIGNASAAEPALAHVILWTDRGIATLAFDVVLAPNDVQTINLRDIFLAGALPVTTGWGFPGCASPLALPPLGDAERATLRAQHTGQPAGPGGNCWASTAGGSLALGFVTVDSVSACSATIELPSDKGYFVAGGSGVANNANTLYGDYFLVADGENYAQGNEAVHLVADASRFGPGLLPTFWESGTDERADNRSPLPTRHRARFLNGGAFDGGTDILAFFAYPGWALATPVACDGFFGYECHQVKVTVLDEAGESETPYVFYDTDYGGPVSSRLHVGDAPLPVPHPFGLLDIENQDLAGCIILPPPPLPLQQSLVVLHSASGRFSVGLNATALADACSAAE